MQDKEVEDKEVEDKEVEDKEVEDKEVEDKEVEDKEVEEKVEEKEVEEKVEEKDIEVVEEPSQFEHLSLIQQLNVLISSNNLNLSPSSATILDDILEVGLEAMSEYIQYQMPKNHIHTLTTELCKRMSNPYIDEIVKYQSLINDYLRSFDKVLVPSSREEVLNYMWARYGYISLRCNIRHRENYTKSDRNALKFLTRVYKRMSKIVNNSSDMSNSELFTTITDFFDSKEKYFD